VAKRGVAATGERAILVEKVEIVTRSRARGLQARADWVDRQVPELIDARTNARCCTCWISM
jgi:hypothetical protein